MSSPPKSITPVLKELINVITNPESIRVEVNHLLYFAIIRLQCPICYDLAHNKSKIKSYYSLKSLGHHIATEHKERDGWYRLSFTQLQELMKFVAFAMQIGMLPYERTAMYPRVKRFEDEE